MLVFDSLTKTFEGRVHPAVDDVDFEVRDGEIVGLVGLNGAGKTTSIRMAAGVALPTSGCVLVDGHDIVHEKRAASARTGWVPEGFPFEVNVRALTLLTYYAGFHGLRGTEARARCRSLLVRVGLGEVANGHLRTFSHGMKKRFAIASAMIADPANVLLDEILNGLDPEGMAFARAWMMEERRVGRAILLSSHLLTELQAIADRIVFVHQGRVIRTINRSELSSAGNAVICLSIENLDDAVLQYLGSVGTVEVDGAVVRLSEPSLSAADLNSELVKRGYRISEIRAESSSLETYFLKLIESAP